MANDIQGKTEAETISSAVDPDLLAALQNLASGWNPPGFKDTLRAIFGFSPWRPITPAGIEFRLVLEVLVRDFRCQILKPVSEGLPIVGVYRAEADGREWLTTLWNYNHLTDSELTNLLRDLGIDSNGFKVSLLWRIQTNR